VVDSAMNVRQWYISYTLGRILRQMKEKKWGNELKNWGKGGKGCKGCKWGKWGKWVKWGKWGKYGSEWSYEGTYMIRH
jgi:hypothetical protein